MRRFYRSHWPIRLAIMSLLVCGAAVLYSARASAAATNQEQPVVSHVLRYRSPEASEVALVWGVNNWQLLPEAQRPQGTTIIKTAAEVMQTPMRPMNGVFEVTVQAPAGATINYIFHITRTRSGVSAEAWDLNVVSGREFYTIAVANGVTDVQPTISLGQELFASGADATSQWIAAMVTLGLTLLTGWIIIRLYARNPYIDY
jgi:hypothetical protein